MASGAMRHKELFAAGRIARDRELHAIGSAISGRVLVRKEKSGNVSDLIKGQEEFRHAFFRSACEECRTDGRAGPFVVQNDDRANQVRPALAAGGVGAMTEGATGSVQLLAAPNDVRRRVRRQS